MDSYVDIRLLPDPEFPASTLMDALFSKFHRGLVIHGEGAIGVSFPDAENNRRGLGERLRLHGHAADLERFSQGDWLNGMRDHITLAGPAPVPLKARHRTVRRVQSHSSPERERRRLMMRKGLQLEEAIQRIPDDRASFLNLPYVSLGSRSTGQKFKLFIEQLPLKDEAQAGIFNAYGLSMSATIPWF
jgi:CRISPR-associated endonuclease Csy4